MKSSTQKEYCSLFLRNIYRESRDVTDVADRFRCQIVTAVVAVVVRSDPPANIDDFSQWPTQNFISGELGGSSLPCHCHRSVVSMGCRDSFISHSHIVVSWNGKMMKDSFVSTQHRQAILITGTGSGVDKELWGVPSIADRTGLPRAQAAYEFLGDWGCEGNVIGPLWHYFLQFREVQGAVTRLESMLGPPLLQLACRGKTTATNDPLSESFRKMWSGFDLSNFGKIGEIQMTP